MADLKSISFENTEFEKSLGYLVPLENGFYDLKTCLFSEYTPEAHFTSKLLVKYNNQARCTIIDGIFSQLLPPDKVIDLYELVAYCMTRSYAYQKVFFLYGKGANGKSVFTAILKRLIGPHNISHGSLEIFREIALRVQSFIKNLRMCVANWIIRS